MDVIVTLAISLLIPISTVSARGGRASPACLFSMDDAPAGALCIHAGSLNRDICGAMEKFATRSGLAPDFFACLIWLESRFRAEAISPTGAQGIAQFMPATAGLRGLKDSFDVSEALQASCQYLMKFRTRFGNVGLASAAFNAGEQRVSTFLLVGGLPSRNYVFGITGHTVDEWQGSASDLALPPLDAHRTFMDACVALAATRWRRCGRLFEKELNRQLKRRSLAVQPRVTELLLGQHPAVDRAWIEVWTRIASFNPRRDRWWQR